MEKMHFNFIAFYVVVKENLKNIGITVAITLSIAVIYCIFATPIFSTKTVINPPRLASNGNGLGGVLVGFTGIANGLINHKTDADITIALLSTNQLNDMVIKQFNLKKYLHAPDNEIARAKFAAKRSFSADNKSGFVTISVEDKDPKLVASIANYYIIALGQVINNVAYNISKQRMDFFEKQINIAKAAVTDSQKALNNFASHNGIVAGQQFQVIVGLSTQLQASLVAAETRLRAMSLYATEENPEYKQLLSEINGYKKELSELSGKNGNNTNDQISIPAGLAPELAVEYQNLMRVYLLNEEIFKIIMRQYEAAKLDVFSQTIPLGIEVVDPAQIPLHKAKPQRLKIVIGVGFLTIICYFIFLLIKHRKRVLFKV